jgi:hypothetical protein
MRTTKTKNTSVRNVDMKIYKPQIITGFFWSLEGLILVKIVLHSKIQSLEDKQFGNYGNRTRTDKRKNNRCRKITYNSYI